MRAHLDAGLGVLADQRNRGLAHRTVGNPGRLVGQTLCVRGELQELHRLVLVGRALRHDEDIDVPDLVVPDDLEGLVLDGDGVEDPAVVDRGHGDFAVGQHLRRLGTGFPPDDVALDLVEHLECPIDALGRGQHVVDIARRDAVGHQGPLEVDLGRLAQAALAREFGDVEEVSQRRGLGIGELRLVEGHHGRPDDRADAALVQGAFDEVVPGGRSIGSRGKRDVVEGLEDAFVAADLGVGQLGIDQIPGHVAGFHLRAHLRQAAVVVLGVDLDTELLGEGLVVGLDLALGIGAAPGNDGDGLVRGRGRDRRRAHRGKRHNGRGLEKIGWSHSDKSP